MTTHSNKKLEDDDLLAFRDRFGLPLSDEQVLGLSFYKPASDSPQLAYLRERRQQLGGSLPQRQNDAPVFQVPQIASYAQFALSADGKEMSTTMALCSPTRCALKGSCHWSKVVPIVADEARTFGMANLFKQVGHLFECGPALLAGGHRLGLELSRGQGRPDSGRGHQRGGAISSWIACGHQLCSHGQPMVPLLHLLFHVRLSADWRSDLGRR